MAVLPTVSADCSSPLIDSVLGLFNISNIDDLPATLLHDVQNKCATGNCTVNLPGCGAQSVDDMNCEVPVFDVGVKLGTNTICDVACFIPGIIDHKCKDACEKELTMQITGDFERMQHVVSSLAINRFNVDCHGNGLTKPLIFDTNVSVGIEDLGLGLKIHTKDLSIGTTTTLSLDQLKVELSLPVNGSVQCGLLPRQKNIDIHIGDTSIDAFDLNFDVNNKAIRDISAVICLDLPFCKNAISDAIDDAIQFALKTFVPPVMSKLITPAIQAVVDVVQCPKVEPEDEVVV